MTEFVDGVAEILEYAIAANEMFARTATKQAPWIVLASDDKKATRLAIVSRVAAAIAANRSDR